jgi:hypothetical protein
MKTADRENPNSRAWLCNEPSPWGGSPEPPSLIHAGWKVRKFPAVREVFFLTLPFIELLGTPAKPACRHCRQISGTAGGSGHLFDDDIIAGRGAAGDGIPVQLESTECCHVASEDSCDYGG